MILVIERLTEYAKNNVQRTMYCKVPDEVLKLCCTHYVQYYPSNTLAEEFYYFVDAKAVFYYVSRFWEAIIDVLTEKEATECCLAMFKSFQEKEFTDVLDTFDQIYKCVTESANKKELLLKASKTNYSIVLIDFAIVQYCSYLVTDAESFKEEIKLKVLALKENHRIICRIQTPKEYERWHNHHKETFCWDWAAYNVISYLFYEFSIEDYKTLHPIEIALLCTSEVYYVGDVRKTREIVRQLADKIAKQHFLYDEFINLAENKSELIVLNKILEIGEIYNLPINDWDSVIDKTQLTTEEIGEIMTAIQLNPSTLQALLDAQTLTGFSDLIKLKKRKTN